VKNDCVTAREPGLSRTTTAALKPARCIVEQTTSNDEKSLSLPFPQIELGGLGNALSSQQGLG